MNHRKAYDYPNGEKRFLELELDNFQSIAEKIKPQSGEIPQIEGLDIYGEVLSLNSEVGGDHIVFVDFKKRFDLPGRIERALLAGHEAVAEKLRINQKRAGILLADASGHNITDGLLVSMLHQAFLTGVDYELLIHGEVTAQLFEILNNRFFKSTIVSKFITLLYGEISECGKFTFLNAGHPIPMVFSKKYDRLIRNCFAGTRSFPPIGTVPLKNDIDSIHLTSRLGYKSEYALKTIDLIGTGDILILFTDGLSEHKNRDGRFFVEERLEDILIRSKEKSAQTIFDHIVFEYRRFGEIYDDFSLVVIKKNT